MQVAFFSYFLGKVNSQRLLCFWQDQDDIRIQFIKIREFLKQISIIRAVFCQEFLSKQHLVNGLRGQVHLLQANLIQLFQLYSLTNKIFLQVLHSKQLMSQNKVIPIIFACCSILCIPGYIVASKYIDFVDQFDLKVDEPIVFFYITLTALCNLLGVLSIALILIKWSKAISNLILAFGQMLCAFAIACVSSLAVAQLNKQVLPDIDILNQIYQWSVITVVTSWVAVLLMGINIWSWLKRIVKSVNPLQQQLVDQ